MILFYISIYIQQINGQNINTAIRDLQDLDWNFNGWTRFTDGKLVQQNLETDQNCQVNLMPITDQQQLRKTYQITDVEFSMIYIEMEIYFLKFTDSVISISVNGNIIYQNTFQVSNVSKYQICRTNFDASQTVFKGFYENQNTLQLEINYQQINKVLDSYIGIRNLNIYTNGIPLLDGCPLGYFIQVDGSCVESCNQGCQYLSGPYLRYCANDLTCNSKLLNTFLKTSFQWRFPPNTAPTIEQRQQLTQISRNFFVNNNNEYTNIMSSSLFNYKMTGSRVYVALQNFEITNRIQISFIFYIIGEWGDGSAVNIQIFGQNIQSNAVRIQKTRLTYTSTTQSQFYFTNLTNSQGQQVVARKTQINFSAIYYTSTIFIYFNNLIKNQGEYGYGDFFIYEADSIPNALLYGLYGIVYSCSYPYFAYYGTCMLQCPSYSSISISNGNCTDLLQTETQIYNPSLKINSLSQYLIQSFYDNNFNELELNEIFQIMPLRYKNQQNGQFFSFVKGKKIVGGFGSWGYGTYGIYVSSLSPHYQLRIYFTLYLIDHWKEGDNFSIYVDGQLISSYTQLKQEQLQGLPTLDQEQIIKLDIFHTLQTSQILFACNLSDLDSLVSSCGISDIFILIDSNSDLSCPNFDEYLSFFTFQCEPCNSSPCMLYPDYNPYTNKCTQGCIDCQQNICQACDYQSGFQLSGTSCVSRDGFFMLSNIPRSCHYQCSTCVGSTDNQCQSCDKTRIFSEGKCICNQNYIDVFSLRSCQQITSNCHYTCNTCYGLDYYQCVTCDINAFRQISIQTYTSACLCMPNYSENEKKQCLYQYCHFNCQTCSGPLNNNCLSCKDDVTLVNGYCLCFDIVKEHNQCIDCNSEEGIKMVECKYANPNDGIWTYGEQCDNGNQLRSGCLNNQIQQNYQCLNIFKQPSMCYKCPEHCIQCEQLSGMKQLLNQNNIVCTLCDDNYFKQETTCLKCRQETCQQCLTPYTCNVCPNNIVIKNGQCICTEHGYELINNLCQSICGDAIKTIDEECDDGNTLQLDGCDQYCKIELNYYCSTQLNQQSICNTNTKPYLVFNEVSKYQTNKQSFIIFSSQKLIQSNTQLQIKSNLSNSIILEYHINYQNEDCYFLQIDFNLTFQQSVESTTIQFFILGELRNIYNQTLKENFINKSFENINIMTEQQQSINSKLSTAGTIAINTLSYSIFTTLLFGDLSSAILLLNMIKQLQYIQYINIDFPPNFQEFLQIFDGVFPIKLLQFDFFELEIQYQRPQQQKFQQLNINSSLINNLIRLIPLIVIGCLLNYILKATLVLVLNFIQTQLDKTSNSLRVHIYFKNIQQQLIKAIKQFRKIGLIEVTQSFSFEITFAIILQLSNYQNSNPIDIIDQLLAIFLLIKYFQAILSKQHRDQQQWQQKLVQMKMFESFLFQFAIINLQGIPLCQIITISINSFVMFIQIIQLDTTKQKLMKFNYVIQELTLSVAALTLLAYIYFPIYIDPISLGWIQIYLLLQMIAIILFIQIFQLGLQVKVLLQKK